MNELTTGGSIHCILFLVNKINILFVHTFHFKGTCHNKHLYVNLELVIWVPLLFMIHQVVSCSICIVHCDVTIVDHMTKTMSAVFPAPHIWQHMMPQLPEFMIGDFQMETSEGFNDFMYEMGVNWFNRKVRLVVISFHHNIEFTDCLLPLSNSNQYAKQGRKYYNWN